MKHLMLISSLVAVMTFLSACDEQREPRLTDEAAERLILEKIETNQVLSLDLFNVLRNRIDTDSLKRLLAKSKTREEFIDLMAEQTSSYFKDVVELNLAGLSVQTVPMPFMGEAEITLKLLYSDEGTAGAAPYDPVQAYSDLVLKRINEEKAKGHKDWIVVESLQTPGSHSHEMPIETMSLNFEQLKMLTTLPHTIILDIELLDTEMHEALGGFLKIGGIPPVAIGLLLPAVQKVRETAATASQTPFEQGLLAWFDDTVEPIMPSGLDHDLIRRIQASVFLAGLHAILLPEYQNKNQDQATLSVLHAQYRAAVICTAREIWNNK
ncbi:MAG: hypothetical protein KF687_11290 [Cyclobacteriaceae bacterium]|nr:hypothetical protein [Cyclobacteriaceae bacterium]